jgi:hypothetical protein
MKSWIEKILVTFLLINFIGIWGFWTFFVVKPSEPITLELITHILSEYATGLLALVSFILFIKRPKTFRIFVYFSIGMLFYASLQATGWAISTGMYPFLVLMVLNMILIGAYMLVSVSNRKTLGIKGSGW